MNTLLEEILKECNQYIGQGRVANYIPELAKANPERIGICIINQNNEIHYAGDYQETFTMQSVIKPMILLLALIDSGIERVRDLVGVEATGKPFD